MRTQSTIRALLALAALCAASGARAAEPSALPPYRPTAKLHGVLRTWGSDEMAAAMAAWERGFSKYQPGVFFVDILKGSDTAHAALYTDVADLALMSRGTYLTERYGLWVRKHRYPVEIAVATGSASDPDRTFALAIFVNAANPLSHLSMRQLDGIFGADRSGGWDPVKFAWRKDVARGPEGNIRTWGQAGLTGDWSEKAVHPYGYPITAYAVTDKEEGAMYDFRVRVLSGADKWNFDIKEYETGAEIARAVGADPLGIGYTALSFQHPGIKAVAIAPSDTADPVALTPQTAASRSYPLTRPVYACVDRAPGAAANPILDEFLTYVLSADGQADAARGGYLPLTAPAAAAERRKLK